MKLITSLIVSLTLSLSTGAFAAEEQPAKAKESILGNTVATVRTAASELIVHAMGLIGVNYQYGGNTADTGFDCSGFVSHVFREAAGVTLPHNAYQMSLIGQKIPNKELRPGDLVFFNTLKRAFSHVGIYIGDNKFIHSPSPGRAVEIVDMKEGYWVKRYQGARRVSDLEQSTSLPVKTDPTPAPALDANQAKLSGILH